MIAFSISEPPPAASSSAVLPFAPPCGVPAAVPFYVAIVGTLLELSKPIDTVHGRVKSPLATPFSERRSEGADNARIRPLGLAAVPQSMPSERGRNRPAASDLAAVPLLITATETTTPGAEWAKAGIGIVAGVLLLLAVEAWAFVDLGFIRLKDQMAAEKAVAAAYWDECYSKIAVNPQED